MATMKRMRAFANFDEYLAEQTSENQIIIRELRKLVKRVTPSLVETVKWGNGCWMKERQNLAYVYSATDHVQFGFFGGAVLKDPKALLEGSGKYLRHVKVRTPADIDEIAFATFLRQAAGLK